jgi:hypothetical protein
LLTRSTTWFETSAGNQRVRLGVADLVGEPPDEVGVGELEDDPVGDPAGHRERHRPVAGDPDRKLPAGRPGEAELGALVLDRVARDERADDPDRLLGVGERERRLAEDAAGRIAAPDPEVEPPVGELLEDREGRGGDGWLARRGVRDARPEAEAVALLGHEREQRVRVAPEDVRIEQPAVVEARVLGLARQGEGAIDRMLGLERESELHRSGLLRVGNLSDEPAPVPAATSG